MPLGVNESILGVRLTMLGVVGAFWGISGVLALLVYAIVRLSPYAMETLSLPMEWYHWLALVINTLFMAHAEGYRGFQKSFAPRVAARARHLKDNPNLLHVLLSPLFCMGYFHSPLRRRISVYALTLMIVLLIVLVKYLEQPWRGIIDAGVVVGLSWGVISIVLYSVRAFVVDEFQYSPELPIVKTWS